MILFLWNVFLAVAWALAVGQFTLAHFAVGLAIGYAVLWFARPIFGDSTYLVKVPQGIRFFILYVLELIIANLRVARDVLTPNHRMRPGVIAIPLDAKTDAEITLLANLITLTPGSLALFLSPDRSVLYVHEMYLEPDAAATRHRLKDKFERRVLELLQ